jgi:peptidoglycan/LPS O-acetylase OafA/YrhL
VVSFHAGVTQLRGGFIGVDVFFVLSGYLITGLLVHEVEGAGRLDFWRFYARRARRLLPAAALVVLTTLVASALIFSPLELAAIARSARATSAYLSNVYFMLGATDYFSAGNDTNPLLHTWSLAVEEQFYLVWPFLVWLGIHRARSRARFVALAVGVSLISFAGCVWLTGVRQPWAFFASPARAWEFGAGAIASMLPAGILRQRRWFALLLGGVGLLAVCASAWLITGDTAFPGLAALPPVLGTAAVLAAGDGLPGGGVGRLLEIGPLQYLGRLSYSWYLWHWPVLILCGAWIGSLGLTASLTAAAVSLGIADLAYRLVENPIRFHPRLLSAPARRTIWLALLVTGGSIAVARGFLALADARAVRDPYRQFAEAATESPGMQRDGCVTNYGDPAPRECVYGDPKSTYVVVAFGDSHTAQWFPAMEQLARARDWRLVYFSRSACPSIDVPIYNAALKRVETECSDWRHRVFVRIRVLHPSLVVLSNTFAYVKRPGSRDVAARLSFGDWREGTRRTVLALTAEGLPVILLRDSPRPEIDVPRCLARAAHLGWLTHRDCTLQREHVLNAAVHDAEVQATQGMPLTAMMDLTTAFCDATTCPTSRNGIVIYRDKSHLTTRYVQSLVPLFSREFDRALSKLSADSSATRRVAAVR